MTRIRILFVLMVTIVLSLFVGYEAGKKAMGQVAGKRSYNNSDLGKVLWDADQQWLCGSGAGPYHKVWKDCVKFRSEYWPDQFFEISDKGQVQTKAQMIAAQSVATHIPGVGPYPDDFKLMAVYGNFALATDHTALKTVDASGKLAVTLDTRVLRMFVKENGEWRPAGAALVPIVSH